MPRSMRVLYVEQAVGFGGALTSLVNEVLELKQLDVTPEILVTYKTDYPSIKCPNILSHLIVTGERKRFNEKVLEKIKKISSFPRIQWIVIQLLILRDLFCIDFKVFLKVLELCRFKKYGLIHVNNFAYCNLAPLLASKILGIPNVCHQRTFEKGYVSNRIAARLVDQYIAVSNIVKKSLMEELKVPEEKIAVIRHGLPLELLSDNISAEKKRNLCNILQINTPEVIIGMTSCLTPWKGHDVALRAFVEVHKSYKETHLVIVGDTPDGQSDYKDYLINQCAALGILGNTHFIGYAKNVSEWLAGFDMFLHPHVMPDPYPQAVLEAMSVGLPVVVSGLGGPCEMISHGDDGFLVTPPDASVFAEYIRRLIEDPHLREIIGKKAREKMQGITIHNEARKIYECYMKVFDKK
jgi:glycosyltransferase involved in cell wall biosynthesis